MANPGLVFHRFVETLQRSSRAVTTANFYLRNVFQFLGYFKQTKPKLCRLSQTQIIGLERLISKTLRDLRKKVTLHQVEVKRVKMARVITVANLQRCHHRAKAKISSLLGEHLSTSALTAARCLPSHLH